MKHTTKSFEFYWSKEFVYFLGYLWSDGFIERSRVILEILEKDALEIYNYIKNIDFLNIHFSKRERKNRQPQISIYFCNVKFYDEFLFSYFEDKSKSSPLKLLEIIPENLTRYFYLGLIDGDGCFYISKNGKTKQFYITSSYEQDWTHMENLCKQLNIHRFEIRQIVANNNSKSSYLRIKKYDELEKLINYLYPNDFEIGLKRKYEKCKLIIKNRPKKTNNTLIINKDELFEKINSGLNIKELTIHFNCCWKKIYNYCKKNDVKYNKGFFSK